MHQRARKLLLFELNNIEKTKNLSLKTLKKELYIFGIVKGFRLICYTHI